MKSELETLQQALYAAGAAVYQQAAGAEAGGAAPGGNAAGAADSSPAGDDVIDAEFTESK
jgi:molecular chaperone DnaK